MVPSWGRFYSEFLIKYNNSRSNNPKALSCIKEISVLRPDRSVMKSMVLPVALFA